MRLSHLAITLLGLLSAAGAAHADPLTDLQRGTRVVVTVAVVESGDIAKTLSSNSVLEKREGSLDIEIPAKELGFDLPITLHLRGTAERDRVEYELDEHFEEPLVFADKLEITNVTGHLSMRALALPGTIAPEVGNAVLVIADKSYVAVGGSWGALTFPVSKLVLQGGIRQPALDSVTDRSERRICSDRKPTTHAFEISLAGDARGDGALVELQNGPERGVLLPAAITVPAGYSSATVNALIAPDFVGRARISAASGGVERVIEVDVHAARDCAKR